MDFLYPDGDLVGNSGWTADPSIATSLTVASHEAVFVPGFLSAAVFTSPSLPGWTAPFAWTAVMAANFTAPDSPQLAFSLGDQIQMILWWDQNTSQDQLSQITGSIWNQSIPSLSEPVPFIQDAQHAIQIVYDGEYLTIFIDSVAVIGPYLAPAPISGARTIELSTNLGQAVGGGTTISVSSITIQPPILLQETINTPTQVITVTARRNAAVTSGVEFDTDFAAQPS